MKAIMIAIKPKWCAKIMNGDKTIEVRKNKALATAIQKLIDMPRFMCIARKKEKCHLFITKSYKNALMEEIMEL